MDALPKGQYIKHYRYGFGVIIESNEEGTSIEFETHGSKSFVTSLMVVELSDLTPPKQFRGKWVKTIPPPRSHRSSARKTVVTAPEAATAMVSRSTTYVLPPSPFRKTRIAERSARKEK